MGNSNSLLIVSLSQSDCESYYSGIADTKIDIEKDLPQISMFLLFKKVSKESQNLTDIKVY